MPAITTPVSAYTNYNSLTIEFTTDDPASSVLDFSFTDRNGVPRTGQTSQAGYETEHYYLIKDLPRETTVTYTITARFSGGVTDSVGPNTVDTKSPQLSPDVRTANVTVPASEIAVQDIKPALFQGVRGYKMLITVSANTEVRFEEKQETMTLLPNIKYEFFPTGNVYLTGASTANIAIQPNPNY